MQGVLEAAALGSQGAGGAEIVVGEVPVPDVPGGAPSVPPPPQPLAGVAPPGPAHEQEAIPEGALPLLKGEGKVGGGGKQQRGGQKRGREDEDEDDAFGADKKKQWGGESAPELKGKRFTKEENAKLKESIVNFLVSKDMPHDDEGIRALLKSGHKKETVGAWGIIAEGVEGRCAKACLQRAQRQFDPRNYKGKWKEEEEEKLRDLVQQSNGKPSWVTISKQLDRNEKAVANKWREIKLGDNRKKGRWSQEEKDMLEKLVMESLRRMGKTDEVNSTKVLLNQKKEKQRDKIDWTAISEKMGTRTFTQCLEKWYNDIAPKLAAKPDDWSDREEDELLQAMLRANLDQDDDVKWERLMTHRTGTQCKSKWRTELKCWCKKKKVKNPDMHTALVSIAKARGINVDVAAAGGAAGMDSAQGIISIAAAAALASTAIDAVPNVPLAGVPPVPGVPAGLQPGVVPTMPSGQPSNNMQWS